MSMSAAVGAGRAAAPDFGLCHSIKSTIGVWRRLYSHQQLAEAEKSGSIAGDLGGGLIPRHWSYRFKEFPGLRTALDPLSFASLLRTIACTPLWGLSCPS